MWPSRSSSSWVKIPARAASSRGQTRRVKRRGSLRKRIVSSYFLTKTVLDDSKHDALGGGVVESSKSGENLDQGTYDRHSTIQHNMSPMSGQHQRSPNENLPFPTQAPNEGSSPRQFNTFGIGSLHQNGRNESSGFAPVIQVQVRKSSYKNNNPSNSDLEHVEQMSSMRLFGQSPRIQLNPLNSTGGKYF